MRELSIAERLWVGAVRDLMSRQPSGGADAAFDAYWRSAGWQVRALLMPPGMILVPRGCFPTAGGCA